MMGHTWAADSSSPTVCSDPPFSSLLRSESTVCAADGGGACETALIDRIVRLKSPS